MLESSIFIIHISLGNTLLIAYGRKVLETKTVKEKTTPLEHTTKGNYCLHFDQYELRRANLKLL